MTDKFTELGREHGYPECCIAAFTEDLAKGVAPGAVRPLHPTSLHVMCSDCAGRYATTASDDKT